MIRSVATLFAKKTAVVAVSGLVILGGATLALAADGEQAPSPDATTSTTVEETTTTSTPDDTTTTSTPDETTTATTEPEDEVQTADTVEEQVEEEHGAEVSEAARVACWEDAYRELYGNHGQCVKTFAHGEGLTLEEVEAELAKRAPAPAAAPTSEVEDGTTDSGEADEGSDDTADAKIETAKPGKGPGNGGGTGNGKKG